MPNKPTDDLIKSREVLFVEPHPSPDQAGTAATLLEGMDGVLAVEAPTTTRLLVTYELPQLTLAIIEESLNEVGFHLDGSLMSRLRRALVNYLEDTQCANLGFSGGQSDTTVKVFVNRYDKMAHGCRDSRPQHWRDYH